MGQDRPVQDAGTAGGNGSSYEKTYQDALNFVRDNYYLPDKAKSLNSWEHRFDHKLNSEAERDDAIVQMTHSLNDTWTEFTSKEGIEEQRNIFAQGMRSAGVWVKMSDAGKPEVSAVLHELGGFASPLRAGDTLVSINGQSLEGKSASDIENKLLQGKVGETLKVQYKTPPSDELKTADITISALNETPASAKIMQAADGSKFLYTYLPSFDQAAVSAFDEAIDNALKSNGGESLPMILDLRGNSGGFIRSARYVESEFLKDGVAYKQIVREGDKQVAYDRNVFPEVTTQATPMDLVRLNELRNVPLVVLMDDSSRSAAETLIAGLRDRHRSCVTVGTHTFGKDIVYDDTDMLGGNMRVSSSYIESPLGANWHNKGLVPDIVVERPRDGSREDVQLARAIEALQKAPCKSDDKK